MNRPIRVGLNLDGLNVLGSGERPPHGTGLVGLRQYTIDCDSQAEGRASHEKADTEFGRGDHPVHWPLAWLGLGLIDRRGDGRAAGAGDGKPAVDGS